MAEAFPRIKKKINAFLVGEEGKISKKSLISTGAFLGTIALSSAVLSTTVSAAGTTHTNQLFADYTSSSNTVQGSHVHHGSHSSHASHGSHGSHGSHTSVAFYFD